MTSSDTEDNTPTQTDLLALHNDAHAVRVALVQQQVAEAQQVSRVHIDGDAVHVILLHLHELLREVRRQLLDERRRHSRGDATVDVAVTATTTIAAVRGAIIIATTRTTGTAGSPDRTWHGAARVLVAVARHMPGVTPQGTQILLHKLPHRLHTPRRRVHQLQPHATWSDIGRRHQRREERRGGRGCRPVTEINTPLALEQRNHSSQAARRQHAGRENPNRTECARVK
jgi:hypothetical protein